MKRSDQKPERLSWRGRIGKLAAVWQVSLLFGVSIGGIYLGWFSPTEAAAVGAFGAFILAFLSGRLTARDFADCIVEAVLTTAVLLFIVIGATFYAYFMVQTRLPATLVAWIGAMGLHPVAVMVAIIVVYVVAGCFLDGIGMVLITVPVFLPLVIQSGFDPVWFGVLLVIVVEIGLIHPPVGMNLFVLHAQAPDLRLRSLYLGVVPFLAAQAALIVLLFVFPDIALWLPRHLFR